MSSETKSRTREEGLFLWFQERPSKALDILSQRVEHRWRIANGKVTWLDSYFGRFTQVGVWTFHMSVDLLSDQDKWGILPTIECFWKSPAGTRMWRDVSQEYGLGSTCIRITQGMLVKAANYHIPSHSELVSLQIVIISSWHAQTAPFVQNILTFSFSILLSVFWKLSWIITFLKKSIISQDRIDYILRCASTVPFNYFYTECSGTLMHCFGSYLCSCCWIARQQGLWHLCLCSPHAYHRSLHFVNVAG